jgi:hypothetical protein
MCSGELGAEIREGTVCSEGLESAIFAATGFAYLPAYGAQRASRQVKTFPGHANISTVSMTDTSPAAQAVPLRVQRKMPGEERLLMALEMSLFTRELAKERIRRELPEWSDTDVQRELLRRAFLSGPMPASMR